MNLLFQKLKHAPISGQVVVLMVLLIAAIVVFIAVAINLGKVAQTKAFLSIATDSAAISSASAIGSYALGLKINILGGENEVQNCEPSGLAKFLGEIFEGLLKGAKAFFNPQEGGPAGAIVGFVMKSGAAAINWANYADVKSAFDKQWAQLTVEQRFKEQMLQDALAKTVNDPIEVDDVNDLDMDGVTTNTGSGRPADKISRFLALYEERLREVLRTLTDLYSELATFQRNAWKNYVCYLNGDYVIATDPATKHGYTLCEIGECACKFVGCADEDTFLKTLGIDDNGLAYSSGLYRLFYEIEAWGYNLAPWQPGPDNDQVDEMDEKMHYFTAWSASVLFNPLLITFPPDLSLDYEVTTQDLLSTFQSWYPSLYHPKEVCDPATSTTWYCLVPYWQAALRDMSAALTGAIEWIVQNKCGGLRTNCSSSCVTVDPANPTLCSLSWEDRIRQIENGRCKIDEALTQTNTFYEALKKFIDVANSLFFGNRTVYSWRDGFGWHHVYVEVSHTELPHIKWDEGNVNDCRKLEPRWYKSTNGTNGIAGGGWLKIRIVRYDQNQAQENALTFASGSPLWRFLFTHPQATGPSSDPAPGTLGGCNAGGGDAGFDCKGMGIEDALMHGIKKESCAQWGPNQGEIGPIPCS